MPTLPFDHGCDAGHSPSVDDVGLLAGAAPVEAAAGAAKPRRSTITNV